MSAIAEVSKMFHRHRVEFLIPLSIFFVALSVRAIALDQVELRGDEPVYIKIGLWSMCLISQGKFSDLMKPYLPTIPPVGYFIIGLVIWMMGYRSLPKPFPPQMIDCIPLGPWDPCWNKEVWTWPEAQINFLLTARVASVVFSSLTCVVIYYLGKTLKDRKIGLMAAILWAFNPLSLLLGRVALLESIMIFFLTSSILTFYKGIQQSKLTLIILSGVLFGLTAGSKAFGWLLIPIWFFWLLNLAIGKYLVGLKLDKAPPIRYILFSLLTVLLVGIVTFVAVFPYLWPNPVNQFLKPFMVARRLHEAGEPGFFNPYFLLQLVVKQKGEAVETGATLTVLEIVFFALGTVFAIWQMIKTRRILLQETLLLLWFAIPILFLSFFIKTKFWSYPFIVTPAVAILAAIGVDRVFKGAPMQTSFMRTGAAFAVNIASVLMFYPTYRYDNFEDVIIRIVPVKLGVLVLIPLVAILTPVYFPSASGFYKKMASYVKARPLARAPLTKFYCLKCRQSFQAQGEPVTFKVRGKVRHALTARHTCGIKSFRFVKEDYVYITHIKPPEWLKEKIMNLYKNARKFLGFNRR